MTKKLLSAAFIMILAASALAQTDSTRFINGLPVSEDDTARQFPQRDFAPENKIEAVTESKLPEEVREALHEGEQYQGWQDTTIYFEKNTGYYIVPVSYENGIRIFRLNREGNPVSFSDISKEQ